VVHPLETPAVGVGEIASIGAGPPPPLAIEAWLAGGVETAVARIERGGDSLRDGARQVHVHQVDIEEEGTRPVARLPEGDGPVDDLCGVAMALVRAERDQLEAVELPPEHRVGDHPRMGTDPDGR